MRKFYPAKIIDKREETRDSIVLMLQVPAEQADEFRYLHGQHVPVRAEIDGENIRRTYSICSSVDEQALKLGIRVQDGGLFSNYIAAQLGVGDTLEIMPPTGHFNTPLDPDQEKTYAAFVAGSGITPILSIVKSTLEIERKSRFSVFYGNRMRATTMFVEDLWALKNIYRDRLSLHFIMSQEAGDIDIYNGRLDAAKISALHEAFLDSSRPDEIFLCGPNPMIDELTTALVALGYDRDRIHAERFRPGLRGEATPRPKRKTAPEEGTEITVVMDGQRQRFHMSPDDESILDAARSSGLDLPYSCKGGVCSTCRSLLTKGDVEMAVNYALEPWELEKGYVLTCQASPKTREIELDFDQT